MTTEQSSTLPRALPAIGALKHAAGLRDRAAHLLRNWAWIEVAAVVAVFAAIIGVRFTLAPWQSGDYTIFLQPWTQYLETNGFAGLGQKFADYNMPYLYLLYIGTVLPVGPLAWIKLVGFASDIAMAAGAAAILAHFRLPRHLVVFGAAAVLLLPEVILNSAAWGQADSTYTAFIVWALWAALKKKPVLTWVLFGLAFTFKLQAAFLLPVFVVVHLGHRWKWWTPLAGVVAALATDIPALIAGRSPLSLAQVYVDQTNGYHSLTMNAPNIYMFIPDGFYDTVRPAGMLLAIAVVGLVSAVVLRRARRSPLPSSTVLLFAATLGLLAPFVLPQMHERYFYVGNVLLFVLALTNRRYLPLALVGQATAVISYQVFLMGTATALPMPWVALIESALVLLVTTRLLRECGFLLTDEQLDRSLEAPAPQREPSTV